MTDLALPPLRLGGCREVSAREGADVWAALAADPLVACPAAERVAGHGVAGGYDGRLFTRGGPAHSLFFVSGTVLPLRGDGGDMRAFARLVDHHGIGPMSVHGRRENVELLWAELTRLWGPARDFRDRQTLMALVDSSPLGSGDPRVRPAVVDEFESVLAAATSVYREELGTDPLAVSGGVPFRRRVARAVARGRSWVLVEDDRVVFKADVAAASPRVAQLQGVWVAPDRRGGGLASSCLAAVCGRLQSSGLTPSLVVNRHNEAALRTYERLGMDHVLDYATVLVS